MLQRNIITVLYWNAVNRVITVHDAGKQCLQSVVAEIVM